MFWKNFVDICSKNGTTPTEVVMNLKIARGSVTSWKKGSTPTDVTLQKIADYFGVTVEYLLRDEKEEALETTASAMDDLTEEERKDVLAYIEFVKSKRGK